jgi:hypothetical protein
MCGRWPYPNPSPKKTQYPLLTFWLAQNCFVLSNLSLNNDPDIVNCPVCFGTIFGPEPESEHCSMALHVISVTSLLKHETPQGRSRSRVRVWKMCIAHPIILYNYTPHVFTSISTKPLSYVSRIHLISIHHVFIIMSESEILIFGEWAKYLVVRWSFNEPSETTTLHPFFEPSRRYTVAYLCGTRTCSSFRIWEIWCGGVMLCTISRRNGWVVMKIQIGGRSCSKQVSGRWKKLSPSVWECLKG